MKINYIHEPTDLQCGQAVLAMIIGTTAEAVCKLLDNDRETNLREMKDTLRNFGFTVSDERVAVQKKAELPPLCMLSLETPRCWHWSLYCNPHMVGIGPFILTAHSMTPNTMLWRISPNQTEDTTGRLHRKEKNNVRTISR